MSEWRFNRPPDMPLPQPALEAQPFFDALRERRLVAQRCSTCGSLAHPPRAMCGECQGTTFAWQDLSGKGVVYSYVVTHQAVHPAFAGPHATGHCGSATRGRAAPRLQLGRCAARGNPHRPSRTGGFSRSGQRHGVAVLPPSGVALATRSGRYRLCLRSRHWNIAGVERYAPASLYRVAIGDGDEPTS